MNFSSSIHINKSGIIGLVVLGAVIILIYRSNSQTLRSTGEPPNSDLISLKELLSASIDAAIKGGNEVRRVREMATLNQQSKGKTKEGVNDPVTDGDMLSHVAMFYSLHKAFPTLEIVSEEHDTEAVDASAIQPANTRDSAIERLVTSDTIVYVKDVTVWIDPLDATKEYTEDLRQYVTTMVGVAVKGVPTLGVVHRPFTNTTHWGWLGHGLSADLADIKQHPPQGNSEKVGATSIIVSISHQGTVKDVAKAAFGESTVIIPAAGAGYKILEVIQGNADAYVHTTAIKKWDLCAGHAILRAMGGTLTSLAAGEDITYGDRVQYKVEQGLLATMKTHDFYLSALQSLKAV